MVSQCCSRLCPQSSFSDDLESQNISAKRILDESKVVYEDGVDNWGKVIFTWKEDVFTYIFDSSTQEIYNDDSKILIRIKCAYLVPRTTLDMLASVVSRVAYGRFKEMKSVFYNGIQCVRSALYGIVNPYEGRKLYSLYERMNNGDDQIVDRRKKCYLALCFVPLNFNTTDKSNRDVNMQALTKNIIKNKYHL